MDSYDEIEVEYDIGICQGCGRYGEVGRLHIKDGEECGEYL